MMSDRISMAEQDRVHSSDSQAPEAPQRSTRSRWPRRSSGRAGTGPRFPSHSASTTPGIWISLVSREQRRVQACQADTKTLVISRFAWALFGAGRHTRSSCRDTRPWSHSVSRTWASADTQEESHRERSIICRCSPWQPISRLRWRAHGCDVVDALGLPKFRTADPRHIHRKPRKR
jgi:hypothetical protein